MQIPSYPPAPEMKQNATQDDYALRSYFMLQGQNINRLYALLQFNAFARGFKTFISVLLEILMYVIFVAALAFIILIPSDPVSYDSNLSQDTSLSLGFHSDQLSALILSVKVIIFFVSLPVLFCAVLLRRNRKKNALLKKACREAEIMKNAFDEALQYFRF